MTSETADSSRDKPKADTESNAGPAKTAGSDNVWVLENAFPDAASLLIASRHFTAADSDVLVVLDTNVLMLPFEVSKQDLAEIEKVFSTLASEGRLFVPGRVIREFINRRDKRLAEIVQGMFDKSSIAARKIETPPILEGLALTDTATSAFAGLEKSQKQYVEAVRALASVITGWRGNDPVTAIYSRLFDGARVVELPPDRADQEKQWVSRLKQKTPPGYKDAGKPDTGVGDFLIWLSLLQLGDTHGKDLIFVTGEEKADWFVRSNKTGVYPRPELIAEYRQRSKGKDIQLAKLADVLEQMKAPEAVVSEVRTAERAANSAVQFSSLSTSLSHQHAANEILASNAHLVSFDYSTNNGEIVVGSGDAAVTLKFSKSGDRDIQFMKWADSIFIARLKNAAPGQVVQADEFDHTSSMYRIQNGEAFLARNKRGYTLAGRIVSIADDTRHNAPEDNVSFLHSIYAPDQQIVLP